MLFLVALLTACVVAGWGAASVNAADASDAAQAESSIWSGLVFSSNENTVSASGQTTGSPDSTNSGTSDSGETGAEASGVGEAATGSSGTGSTETAADGSVQGDGSSDVATLSDEDGIAVVDDASAVGDTTTTDSDSYGTDIDPVTIYLRVAVDGAWKYVGRDGNIYDSTDDTGYEAITVTKQAYRAGGNRAIISAPVLEGALASFGFSADSEIKRANQPTVDWGNYLFGYCDSGTSTIYNDVTPQYVSSQGTWYVFTKGREYIHEDTGDKSLDLYYLPANRNDGEFTTPSSFFADSTRRENTNSQLLADNTFYTVTVEDGANRIYAADETLPTGYVMTNAGASKKAFTVKKPTTDTAKWKVMAAAGATAEVASVTDNGDGTLTYTFSAVTGPVTFSAIEYDPNKFNVVYSAAMADSDKTTLGNIGPGNQAITENTTIGEGDDEGETLTVSVDATDAANGDGYALLAPNTDIATVYWTQSTTRKFIYSFMGWKIVGDDSGTVYEPGAVIPYATLKSLAAATGSVTLKSVWSGNDTNTSSPHIRSANFYLNLNCEILDVDGSFTSYGADNYTQSIYSTRVSGTDTFGAGGFTLLASESSDSAYTVDAQIRNATATGTGIKPPSSWTNYTQDGVTFERFPTDEEVLQKVRELGSQIKIDDEVIPTANLTSSNFTVRWYVVKYDTSDGWHIDGVLVAKKARLVVSKTFEGEKDALEAFKTAHGYSSLDDFGSSTGFHIDVTHEAEVDGKATGVTDYQLLLVPDSGLDHSDATDRHYGYTSYDEATNTYTWEIETRQNRLYTVNENNYYLEDTDDWNNLTWYEVHNSSSDYNTNGWTEYDIQTGAAVKVLAAAYPTDVPSSAWQTVGFRNAYVHKGTLAVFKNDYTTGASMGDVAFTVTQTDAAGASALYQKNDTNEYTTDSSVYSANPDAYTKMEDGKAVTDATGVFFLSLAAPDEDSDVTATYELKEDKTTVVGYDGPETITFKMTYNGGIANGDVTTTGGSSEVTWAKTGTNQFILNIYNKSVAYTSVTAKKQWADESTAKPVTVQLWRKYGDVDEPVPAKGAAGASVLTDVDGTECSNEVQLSDSNSWTFSWGNLPLFINNQSVTYHLRETWIGNPGDADSVAYETAADPEDGYANYAVTTEDARYATGDMPDAESKSGDDLRDLYPHGTSSWTEDGSTTYASHVLLMINNADVRGTISFTKKDRAGLEGKPLAGAVFALFSDADCTTQIESQTSGADGVVAFTKQSAGTYYFKEVSAPAGYSFDAGSVYKAVVSNGTPTITKVGDAAQTAVTSVYNTFGAGLNVRKIGGGDVASAAGVAGAEFMLAKDDGAGDWAEAKRLVTAANGMLTFTGLDQGAYTLTETKTPAGYAKGEKEITLSFTVETDEDTGVTTFTFPDSAFDASAESGFVSYAEVSTDTTVAYTVTVRNKMLYDLPTSGGAGVYWQAAAGTALMCAGAAAWFVHRRGWSAGGGRRA